MPQLGRTLARTTATLNRRYPMKTARMVIRKVAMKPALDPRASWSEGELAAKYGRSRASLTSESPPPVAVPKNESRKPRVPSLPRLVEKREYQPTRPKRTLMNATYSRRCAGTQSGCWRN